MLVIVSYDVNTTTADGRKRLRQIAKLCESSGIRVQNSVFECYVDWSQWLTLRDNLEQICNPNSDSLRYYNLGNNYEHRIEHYGAKPTFDPEKDTLIL